MTENTGHHGSLSLERLRDAVRRDAAFRVTTRLVPAGGDGDKVFPPTYAADRAPTLYVFEDRRIGGQTVRTVLLDSVASQANRLELALQEAIDEGEIAMPLLLVDFSGHESIRDIDRITTLEAPHRIADAIFRDSVIDDIPFRATEIGRSFENATPRNATAMYKHCPHALIFGVWDSTGPKGGLGSKFQRVLTSEIIGVCAEPAKKTASRIDPLGIQAAVDVYHLDGSKKEWTIDPAEAAKDGKGRPRKFGDKGNASAVNHSNIAPSIDAKAGGVTIDYATQTSILSLVGLRQIRFVEDVNGRPLDGEARRRGQVAARTALAALGVTAISLGRRSGFHLRSRALLVPDGPQIIELLGDDGGEPERFSLRPEEAVALYREATAAAAEAGFGWQTEPITLSPSAKLVGLIERSRELAAEATVEAP